MKISIPLTILLYLFWLALSGHYTGLLLFLGALSVIWIAAIARRMDIADHEGRKLRIFSFSAVPYFSWLLVQILLSCVAVARMILSPIERLKPSVSTISAEGMTDIEKVTYANSITLTPGTLTLEVNEDSLEVHSVQSDLIESLESGSMSDRVRRLFPKKKPR